MFSNRKAPFAYLHHIKSHISHVGILIVTYVFCAFHQKTWYQFNICLSCFNIQEDRDSMKGERILLRYITMLDLWL